MSYILHTLQDACPFVYSDVNTDEVCTMHMDIQPGKNYLCIHLFQ